MDTAALVVQPQQPPKEKKKQPKTSDELDSYGLFRCYVCRVEDKKLSKCSRCRQTLYCSAECQKSDWPTHKQTCSNSSVWYDKRRQCQDGSMHEGKLELITWVCPKDETGWGNCLLDECEDLKRRFKVEYGGDESKFYKYWPQGFRWTCCGTDAGMAWGCDHHGSGKKPCTCDFCRMGKPLPLNMYQEQTAPRMGLKLRRGPDPRSYNAVHAATAKAMRPLMGLD